MFKSLTRLFFNNAESDGFEQRLGNKRKRQADDLDEAEDPDIQFVKVEKKRKLEQSSQSESVFSEFLKSSLSKMASWTRENKNNSRDSSSSKQPRHSSISVSSQKNGNHNRMSQKSGVERFQNSTMNYREPGHKLNIYENGHIGAPNVLPLHKHFRSSSSQSSNSSAFGFGKSSTASACIRLKEREEYQQLLQSQFQSQRMRSPWETKVTSRDPSDLSGATSEIKHIPSQSSKTQNTSILGSSIMFTAANASNQHNKTARHTLLNKPSRPIFTPSSSSNIYSGNQNCNSNSNLHYPCLSREKREEIPKDPLFKTMMYRQRQRSLAENSATPITTLCKESSTKVKRNDTIVIDDGMPAKSSRVSSPILIDDEERAEVSGPAGSKDFTGGNQYKSEQPAFLNSVYIKDSYSDIKHTRVMNLEERQKQIQEERYKLKAYSEKRRAQERGLERELKYKMKIFEEEPEVSEEIFLSSDEEEEDTLPELTGEMEDIIRGALRPGNPGEVLSKAFNLQITRRDLATLNGLNWLNDEIINFYMNMLMQRGEQEDRPKVWAFNTFFYPKIMSGGHQAVRRWTKKVDIFAMNFMVIPVHLGMHWCLCIANMQDQVVTYFDSMGGRNNACLEAVRKYINDESVAKKQTTINMSEWTLVNADDNPQQMNGSDCGMFTCKYAEYITRGKPISFSQEDMPYFRRRMVYEILSKELMQ